MADIQGRRTKCGNERGRTGFKVGNIVNAPQNREHAEALVIGALALAAAAACDSRGEHPTATVTPGPTLSVCCGRRSATCPILTSTLCSQ